MSIKLIRYSGEPLGNATLLGSLGISGSYTYIVANLATESSRKDVAPAHQRDADERPQLVFHKALRHWLRQQGVPLLTRAEERVALLRAAAEVAATDTGLALQLRHDVFSWRDALAELAAQGLDLAHGLPQGMEPLLVNPGVGNLLRHLQAVYRRQQHSAGRQPFEEAAYAYLDISYTPTRHVVLEGFTFLTPLQHRFVEVADKSGATVHLLHPYRAHQWYGFQIMADTYAPWLDSAPPRLIDTALETPPSDLRMLQETLFSNERQAASGDGSVAITAHGHRHQEVAACIRQLRALLDSGVAASDIAVVTRNAGNIEALLREEAELQRLPTSLSVPPRLLLLTPLGRFVLALYEVWDGSVPCLDAGQLETILASGWLGGDVQSTADLFSAVRAQFFARCKNEYDWDRTLGLLAQAHASLPTGSRLSASLVTDRAITKWRVAITRIHKLCERLFAGGPRSIGGHVQRLLDELTALAPEQMRESEREVLARIREALTQMADATSLSMSAAEFGEVLNSLVREYERDEDEDQAARPRDNVWVTTPEGIDGRTRKYVFYLGVDSQRAPRAYAEEWPFYHITIDEHQRTERYLFLAVVRAARSQLHLSYARADEDAILHPSPYLEEVADLIGIDLREPTFQVVERLDRPPSLVSPLLPAQRDNYSLAEIAQAGLCPYRYKMERLSPAATVYRDPFQVRFLAQSHWLDRTLAFLEISGETKTGCENVYAMFRAAMNATAAEVRDMFPGLRELDWHTAREFVDKALHHEANEITKRGSYQIRVVPPRHAAVVVNRGDRTTEVSAEIRHALLVGKILRPFLNDMLLEQWLLPGVRSENEAISTELLNDGTKVFATLYHAVSWWREAARTAFEYAEIQGRQSSTATEKNFFEDVQRRYSALQQDIAVRLDAIEAGSYPKHAGDHCRYCPVRLDCLGLEP